MLLPNGPAKADAQITEADMLQQLEIGKDLEVLILYSHVSNSLKVCSNNS